MKLQTIDTKLCPARIPASKPKIRVSTYLYLNNALCKLMGIDPGDRIVFLKDEESGEDLYIAKTTDAAGFPVCDATNGERIIYNRQLAQMIRQFTGIDDQRLILQISRASVIEDGIQMHLVITAPVAREARLQRLRRPAQALSI